MAAKTPAKPKAAAKKPVAKKAPVKKAPAKKPKTQESQATTEVPAAEAPQYMAFGLQPMEALFVDHYIANGFNATRAYKSAGYKAKTDHVAAVEGSRYLRKPDIAAYLAHRMKSMFDRVEEEQDKLLMTMTMVAYGDPNELIEHRREACRYCHGDDHQYQRTPREFNDWQASWEKAAAEAIEDSKEPPVFDPQGGVGFDPRKDPHEDCPECFGEGHSRTVLKDTRHLSPAAQAMYAGVKQTKEGLEMLIHSQEKARDTLAKIRKLYDEKAEVIVNVVPQEKLDAMYADAMEQAAQGREQVKARQAARRNAQEGAK